MLSGVTWVLFLAGPTIAACYLASALVRTWVVDNGDRPSPSVVAEAAAVIALAGGAWLIIRSQAPGRTVFENASAVGFLSSQVLTFWSSVALWAGLAAVVGQMAPVPRRFRQGTSGVAGAMALLLAFLPVTAVAAFGAWFSSLNATRHARPALALTYGAAVIAEWIFSVINPPGPWGVVHGPETTLFVTALAGALLFRWSRGDIATSLSPPSPHDDERP